MKIVLPKAAAAAPVRPNVGIEYWYLGQLKLLLTQMSEDLERQIAETWRADPPEGMATDRSPSVALKRVMEKWGELWISRFDKMARRIAVKFANQSWAYVDVSNAAAFKKAGFTVQFRPTAAMKEAFQQVVGWNVSLIKNLPQSYLNGIQDVVFSSVMKGADLNALNTSLRERYHMSLRRAALIAKDQNSKARAILNQTRHAELGIEFGIWQHSHAVRHPRPSHKAFDGKKFSLKKGVVLDGELVWPGTAINCQCSYRPIIPGFNDEEIAQAKRRAVRSRA